MPILASATESAPRQSARVKSPRKKGFSRRPDTATSSKRLPHLCGPFPSLPTMSRSSARIDHAECDASRDGERSVGINGQGRMGKRSSRWSAMIMNCRAQDPGRGALVRHRRGSAPEPRACCFIDLSGVDGHTLFRQNHTHTVTVVSVPSEKRSLRSALQPHPWRSPAFLVFLAAAGKWPRLRTQPFQGLSALL